MLYDKRNCYFKFWEYSLLYNNATFVCMFIGCCPWSIRWHTHRWCQIVFFVFFHAPNMKHLTRSSINHLNFYCIKRIDYIFPCVCTVIVWYVIVWSLDFVSWRTFCSLRAVTSFVIYYSTHARENVIYLLTISQIKSSKEKTMNLSPIEFTWYASYATSNSIISNSLG